MREANVLVENTNKTARQIEDRITLLRTQCKELNASMQQQDTASDTGGLAPRSSRRSSHLSGGENLTGNSGSMILGSNSTFSSSVNAVVSFLTPNSTSALLICARNMLPQATAPSLSLETVQIGTSTDRISITVRTTPTYPGLSLVRLTSALPAGLLRPNSGAHCATGWRLWKVANKPR